MTDRGLRVDFQNVSWRAAMPGDLIAKLAKAENFDEGYRLTELLAAAELDMQWHLLAVTAPLQDPDEFEKQALSRAHLDIRAVPPRYRSSYFSHIWSSGYSAGYYAYLWTQMLDDDAYQWFDDHGGLTRANGDRFRRMVLSRGNTEELGAMYVAWRGRPPNIDAMMKYRGLTAAPRSRAVTRQASGAGDGAPRGLDRAGPAAAAVLSHRRRRAQT